MYRRPIFSLFTTENAKIASSGDPVNPIYDDGSEEQTPDGEDSVVKYPSGTLNALHFGKLLASGEAGYFDIQNQDYQIERLNSDDVVIKPKGEGIDYVYPNPPDLEGFSERNEYWGLPSGSTKAFFQSGIFIKHNDDTKHLTGSGLKFFTSKSLQDVDGNKITGLEHYTGSIFNRSLHKSAFSNNISTDFLDFWTTDDDIIYKPINGYGVAVNVATFNKTTYTQTFNSLVDTEVQLTVVYEDPVPAFSYQFHKLVPPSQFAEVSTSEGEDTTGARKGMGATKEEALLSSIQQILQYSFGAYVNGSRTIYEDNQTTDTENQTILKTYEVLIQKNEVITSGVIGEIIVASNEENTQTGLFEASVRMEVHPLGDSATSIKSLGTDDLIMHHKGTGEKDPEADENAPIELSPIRIPYLGDYKVIKPEDTSIVQSTADIKQVTYDIKACDAIKSRLEKILEGDEELIQQEEEKSETTDGTTQDNTQ